MRKISIETIPHAQHRYETVGDYWHPTDDSVEVRVSDMGNPETPRLLHTKKNINSQQKSKANWLLNLA